MASEHGRGEFDPITAEVTRGSAEAIAWREP